MSEPVDMVKFVNDLRSRPRGRACVVMTHDYPGQKEWAAELARQTDSEHIDLLEVFYGNKELSKSIGKFMVSDLFEFLEGNSQSSVLVVSGMEFLKASWAGQRNAMEQFTGFLETWHKKPCILFVLQYDKAVANREFRRFRQYRFVVDQNETIQL